jgi:hypothetical protein
LTANFVISRVSREKRIPFLSVNINRPIILDIRGNLLSDGVLNQEEVLEVEGVGQEELGSVPADVHHGKQKVLVEDVDQFPVIEIAHVFRVNENVGY